MRTVLIEKEDLHRSIDYQVISMDADLYSIAHVFPIVDDCGDDAPIYAVMINMKKAFEGGRTTILFEGDSFMTAKYLPGEIVMSKNLAAIVKSIILDAIYETEYLHEFLAVCIPTLSQEGGFIELRPIITTDTIQPLEFQEILDKYKESNPI